MPSESLPLEALQQIDSICDSFEAAWKAGLRPRIEDYLSVPDFAYPAVLLRELLAREVELRRGMGDCPQPADYAQRFAGVDELIDTVFAEPEPSEAAAIEDPLSTQADSLGEAGPDLDRTSPATTWTQSGVPANEGHSGGAATNLPERIGRYKPIRLLGRGNFLVYLAVDEEGDREVALKLTRPDNPTSRRRLMSLAEEARRLAAVDHPGIVKVLDFVAPARSDQGEELCDGFIVLEYVPGSTLEDLFRGRRPEPLRLARIIAAVTDALHHAHTLGLVHRDLKPSNILLDLQDAPRICDFGLAIDEEIQRLRRGEVAGTLPYMAPEQVRGETSRLDGRTDIWALGVILYRGLTGRLPFRGEVATECFAEILRCEPRPPRQFGHSVPREMERICLRCLSRQMSDRYLTAADLGEDLRRWLFAATGETATSPAIAPAAPKGLRNFGAEDAAFFLSLLPGPRGSDGLPESVRFWKNRIESATGDRSFSVGLVYGMSGGGKSSFVKAGLIPQLDPQRVRPIVLDASPAATEARLLAELRRAAPLMPGDCDLAEVVALLRDDAQLRPREKLLIVLDQFEQWLQSRPIEPDTLLIRALRQCDGAHVQVLLLVRDEFWMVMTKLFRAIDVPLIEGLTTMAVELFDVRHSRKVLEEFGRSLGQIPDREIVSGSEPDRFLSEAVSGLTGPDGNIIPVRLSLFVEVVRNRPWTLQTLQALGGMEGIGVKFFEEAFDSPSAPPANRLHRTAAEAVLKLLLPGAGSVLRGAPRSGPALREASGLADRPRDFADLLQVLDHDLRLITPVDTQPLPEQTAVGADGDTAIPPGESCYQLAHDYLIRPIRQWLERHQQASKEGRAHLRLEFITSSWLELPGAHRLPSFLEYLGILIHTRRTTWRPEEWQLMRAATRHLLTRLCILALLIAAFVFGSRELFSWYEQKSLLNMALSAEDDQLPGIIRELGPYRERVIASLLEKEHDAPLGDHAHDVATMLLYRFTPTESRSQYLRELVLRASNPDRVEMVCQCLAVHPELAGLEEFLKTAGNGDADPGKSLRAACALAALAPARLRELDAAIPLITSALLEEPGRQIPGWLELLRPAHPSLIAPLRQICASREYHSATRATAAEALSLILMERRDSAALAEMVVNSRPDASRILLRELASRGPAAPAVSAFKHVLDQRVEDLTDEKKKDERAARMAQAAIGLETLGEPDAVSRLLRQSHPDPRVRALLIERQAAFGVGRPHLLEELGQADVDPSERQGLLLIWAESQLGNLTAPVRGRLTDLAMALFLNDPGSGVHAAAELLLRRLGHNDLVIRGEQDLRHRAADGRHGQWYVGPEGHTFATIAGTVVFQMGSPDARDAPPQFEERQHYRKIDRTIAVATKEVSIAQYRRFKPSAAPDRQFTHELACPINGVNWYDAASYCNWLSQQDQIPREEWCYPERIEPGMILSERSVERTGYRLPTEAEWEYVCRARTVTSRFFGSSEDLLPRYGWTWLNSQDRARPTGQLLPNPLGLFDTLGNLWEWCHDGPEQGKDPVPYPIGTTKDHPAIDQVRGGTIVKSTYRILRGGAFDYSPAQARAAYRYAVSSDYREGTFGFRVVRTLPRVSH